MKKLIIFIFITILICGCTNNKIIENKVIEDKEIINEKENEEIIEKYIDNNTTPIGIYDLKREKLTKVTNYISNYNPMDDIYSFQLFPSQENEINLNKNFGQSFYEEWIKYNPNNNIKQGFNIKFTDIDNNNISYNILNPSMTFDKYEYLLIYLYDDYINQNKSFYSHIENNEYTDNTLFTTIKIQAGGYSNKINSKIELTIFTYDGLDDFDETNEYRGNSKYTIYICKDSNC